MAHADQIERSGSSAAAGLSLAALILLGTRFVQGFIFWGGASRRLIYDFHDVAGVDHAVKLDFEVPGFVAAKLTHALPGALWVQGPIEWTLRHPDLIVASVWIWTFAELAVGLGLMLGLATRLSAFASIWLNVTLMLIFGWMGSTCLDEWTMAVSGVAMSSAVFLAGGGAWSLDERYVAPTRFAQSNAWTSGSSAGRFPTRRCASWRCGSASPARCSRSSPIRSCSAPWCRRCIRARTSTATTSRCRRRTLRRTAASSSTPTSTPAPTPAPPTSSPPSCSMARDKRSRNGTARRWPRCPPDAIRNAYPYAWASRFKTERIGFSGQTGARADDHVLPPVPRCDPPKGDTHPRARGHRRQPVAGSVAAGK